MSRNKTRLQAVTPPPQIRLDAAGIDISPEVIYVAVDPRKDAKPIRHYGSVTAELYRIANWLKACGVRTVAMESTGVYWIPVYDVMEAHGIKACLVNPRNMKNVPGRRTDYHECQWIQQLHTMGLLHSAFRPDSDVREVRSMMRHRNDLVEMRNQHVQHVQKALTQMNVQLHNVISDVMGLTGLRILDAIVAGERDAAKLAKLRDPHTKANEETIRKSLEGTWRDEHIFALKQRLKLYREALGHISESDRKIEELVVAFEPRVDPAQKPLPTARRGNAGARRRAEIPASICEPSRTSCSAST